MGLTVLEDETRCRSTPLLPTPNLGNTAGWGGKRINPRPQVLFLYLIWIMDTLPNDDEEEAIFERSCFPLKTKQNKTKVGRTNHYLKC